MTETNSIQSHEDIERPDNYYYIVVEMKEMKGCKIFLKMSIESKIGIESASHAKDSLCQYY